LTGDFNDEPNATSIQLLSNTGTDTFYVDCYNYVNPGSPGYTMPSDAPNRRIDYVFSKNTSSLVPFESNVVMNQPYSGNNYCSDHLGVLTYFDVGVLGTDEENNLIPEELRLYQNFPNPFNPYTTIGFSVPSLGQYRNASVQLKVYDVLGNEIATLIDEEKSAGDYQVNFNARNISSGMYFYKLQAGNNSDIKKMILLR
ncbi:MAG: T9SS type A sorting domain-containing protein, partial [Ignavibacterium sp.]